MRLIFITLSLLFIYFSVHSETIKFKIGFLDLKNDIRYSDWGRHPVDIRSNYKKYERPIDGARLGVIDSKKFERITKTEIILDHFRFKDDIELINFLNSVSPDDYSAILLDLNLKAFKDIQTSIKDKNKIIFFNISNSYNSLRVESCLNNLYHTFPSDMMKTDAAAQFLVQKKWNKTLLLRGPLNEDVELSKSFKTSAKNLELK